MREIIFARTRWNYDSYTDFWKLVELSGFPICFVDEIDVDKDVVYIVAPMNGEMRDKFSDTHLPSSANAKLLLWNLERPSGSNGMENFVLDNFALSKYFHNILVSDRQLSLRCNDMLNIRDPYFAYTTLGCHEGLGTPGDFQDKHYDLVHLSCYSNHRSWMFVNPSTPMSRIGMCSVAPNGWGEQRRCNLQKSRFMLNIHQDDEQFMEPLRFSLAMAYGLPIITELCYDKYPYSFPFVTEIRYVSEIPVIAKDYDLGLYISALEMRLEFITKFPFRKCVEETVQGLFV